MFKKHTTSLPMFFLVIAMSVTTSSWGQVDDSWVWPHYEASASLFGKASINSNYTYIEREIINFSVTSANAYQTYDYSSPESAFVSRISAMKNLDFNAWEESWEAASKGLVKERYGKVGRTEREWLDIWKTQFVGRNIALQRRLDVEEYVIFTYKILNEEGIDIAGFEFPSVFKKVDQKWLATLNLSRHPLPKYSPWVSGKASVKAQLRNLSVQ